MILRSTAVATARAPVASTKTGVVMWNDRMYTLIRGTAPLPRLRLDRGDPLPPKAGGEAFEGLLDSENLPPRVKGFVQVFVDGEEFFPFYLNAIRRARTSIDVQTYIFDNDPFGVEVADLLKQKSREIPVRVYFDGLGTALAMAKLPENQPEDFKPPYNMRRYLTKDSNVKVRRTMNPYLVADHTKLHLIDGRTAFLGGMNIGTEYRHEWHDLMVAVEGPVVDELIDLYNYRWNGEDWRRNWGLTGWWGDKKDAKSASTPIPANHLQDLRVLRTDTPAGKRDIMKAALLAIRSASTRIWVQTPYFSSDEIAEELEDASERGVDVRIIIPGENDSDLMTLSNLEALKDLIKSGARVYEYPGMTHLKAMVCDDWAMFGSANKDTLSMRINRELSLATSDPRTVKTLEQRLFLKDFRISKPVTEESLTHWGGPIIDRIGDQL
ncbi:phospholipase D-like domain-containing protein [Phragmitibacter flavus]|nr:phosphatidylserine/phosphatidylglycerophosphate/cardiolipin synthase family protein [Phragmitibacter flavus]